MKTFLTALLLGAVCLAQGTAARKAAGPESDYTGMYSFLRDGEFVRINVEDGKKLSGFVSRHSGHEKPMFVSQFFDKAEIRDRNIQFTTREADGVWFEFKGVVTRGPGKTRAAEDYYEIKGTLIQHSSDPTADIQATRREVTFHSLPQEICD